MRTGQRLLSVLLAALPALLAAGCELTEVTAARGEDLLVVNSLLRTGQPEQHVLLHRTLEGRTVRGEPGARVVVRRESGEEVAFRQAAPSACYVLDRRFSRGEDSLRVGASCYVSPAERGEWVVPGERYELAVVTARGERVRGRTHVPGPYRLTGLAGAEGDGAGRRVCTLPPATPLPLVWTRAAGAWAYVVEMEVYGLPAALSRQGTLIGNVPDPLEMLGVSVSESDTTMVVPTEVGVFDRFSLDQALLRAIRDGFPPGVEVRLTLAAVDRNYVNAVRGGSFNPSGSVRVSSVVGDGVGVFGSLVPQTLRVYVRSGPGWSPCL